MTLSIDYKCIKGFSLDRGDFFRGEFLDVPEGSIYHKVDMPAITTAPSAIRLENNDGDWLELDPNDLMKYFAEVDQNDS